MTVDETRALYDRGVAMFSREQVAVLLATIDALLAERERLVKENERLAKDFDVARAFHDVAVKERNYERVVSARFATERDALRADAERYRWMKENVKRIPPGWEVVGWDAAIDAARKATE